MKKSCVGVLSAGFRVDNMALKGRVEVWSMKRLMISTDD